MSASSPASPAGSAAAPARSLPGGRPPPDLTGLDADEVDRLRAAGKSNAAAAPRTKTLAEIAIANVFSLFNGIIAVIIGFFLYLYARHGDPRLPLDCLGVAMVAVFNTVIALVQEIKAKRALDKVRLLLAREVRVVRGAREMAVPPEDLVLGDVVHLGRGDQAVVDGVTLVSNHLEMDESLLTGESVPVEKDAGEPVLSGSFCVSGSGYFKVTAVGEDVYAAKVTRLAKKYRLAPSPLTRRINALVKALFGAAVVLAAASLAMRGARPLDVDFARGLGAILIGLVPQGLVLLCSVTFALGVYRISRVGAVVQKLSAIETFASVTVICMDKTGTLTQNKLSLRAAVPLAPGLDAERAQTLLGTFAALCTEQNATIRALSGLAPDPGATLRDEIPFSSARKLSAVLADFAGSPRVLVLGAFDLIARMLDPAGREAAELALNDRGLAVTRNLILAEAAPDGGLDALRTQAAVPLRPLCLVAISDTVRQDAGRVIADFTRRGKIFKILTGDAAPAVMAVCRDIGWEVGRTDMILGEELDTLSPDAFAAACREKTVFARLSPEHKLAIVRSLMAQGLATAMLGDGVNDLAAIKEADLGLAMEEGSQATKEVADIVLLANRFSLLPEILSQGNTIVTTVAAAAKLFLTKNCMVIALTLLSLASTLSFPLTPRRVSLINIFAIGLPAMLTALRNTNARAYRGFLLDAPSFAAVSALVLTISAYAAYFLARGLSGGQGQSGAEMAMLTAMISLSAVNFLLVMRENRSLRLGTEAAYAAGMVLAYVLLCLVPDSFPPVSWIKVFYEITPMQGPDWIAAAAASAAGAALLALAQRGRQAWLARRGIPYGGEG